MFRGFACLIHTMSCTKGGTTDNHRIINGDPIVLFSSAYKLTVQASDRGSPSMNARVTVTITIVDVNDNSPVFQGLPYRRSIPEDFSTSKVILQVRISYNIVAGFRNVDTKIKLCFVILFICHLLDDSA
jgi:hypothetical protein